MLSFCCFLKIFLCEENLTNALSGMIIQPVLRNWDKAQFSLMFHFFPWISCFFLLLIFLFFSDYSLSAEKLEQCWSSVVSWFSLKLGFDAFINTPRLTCHWTLKQKKKKWKNIKKNEKKFINTPRLYHWNLNKNTIRKWRKNWDFFLKKFINTPRLCHWTLNKKK